jgi:hypothetical protein
MNIAEVRPYGKRAALSWHWRCQCLTEDKIMALTPTSSASRYGFDTLSCFICQSSRSGIVRDKEINDLSEQSGSKVASVRPLLD